jgi:hypothetical protein
VNGMATGKIPSTRLPEKWASQAVTLDGTTRFRVSPLAPSPTANGGGIDECERPVARRQESPTLGIWHWTHPDAHRAARLILIHVSGLADRGDSGSLPNHPAPSALDCQPVPKQGRPRVPGPPRRLSTAQLTGATSNGEAAMTSSYQPDPARKMAPASGARPVIRNKDDRQRFRTRLLAKLPGPGEDAVSTNDLGHHFRLDPYQRSELLWTSLDQMARDGLVERVVKPGDRLRYWRRKPAGDQHIQGIPSTPPPGELAGRSDQKGGPSNER